MAAINSPLLEDKAILIDLFVPLRDRFVCLNTSQRDVSPRNTGWCSLASPRDNKGGAMGLTYGKKKNQIIITWKQERSPGEARGSPSTLSPPSPSSTQEDP